LESLAETAKLERLLGLDGSESLAYLKRVPASELREYRNAVTDLLYDNDHELLARTADAARLLPPRMLAKVGESALGPLVCAHLTGLIDPKRAAEVSEHFSVDFLAQLAAEMDPRRAVEVIVSTPSQRVVEVALAMAARREYVAMGRFVAHLDDRTLGACLERLDDEEVVRVAFVLEGKRPQERVFELVGTARMREVLDSAKSNGLGDEERHLREHLSDAQRKQLRTRAKRAKQ
jgi:hypothetical protein